MMHRLIAQDPCNTQPGRCLRRRDGRSEYFIMRRSPISDRPATSTKRQRIAQGLHRFRFELASFLVVKSAWTKQQRRKAVVFCGAKR
jgi:hypothetical protein